MVRESLRPRRANPRRALRVTQSIVGKRFRRTTIAARYTRAFGRPAEAGRRAGGGKKLRYADSCRRPWSSAKAARGPLTVSSGAGRRGSEARAGVPLHLTMCRKCTILATALHTTRLGSSALYGNLCSFCTNAVAPAHRVTPHWEIV